MWVRFELRYENEKNYWGITILIETFAVAWIRNVSHSLGYLRAWPPVGGAVLGRLRRRTSLEVVSESLQTPAISCAHSLLHPAVEDVSSQPPVPAIMPSLCPRGSQSPGTVSPNNSVLEKLSWSWCHGITWYHNLRNQTDTVSLTLIGRNNNWEYE